MDMREISVMRSPLNHKSNIFYTRTSYTPLYVTIQSLFKIESPFVTNTIYYQEQIVKTYYTVKPLRHFS
jgi:hypothetical protein